MRCGKPRGGELRGWHVCRGGARREERAWPAGPWEFQGVTKKARMEAGAAAENAMPSTITFCGGARRGRGRREVKGVREEGRSRNTDQPLGRSTSDPGTATRPHFSRRLASRGHLEDISRASRGGARGHLVVVPAVLRHLPALEHARELVRGEGVPARHRGLAHLLCAAGAAAPPLWGEGGAGLTTQGCVLHATRMGARGGGAPARRCRGGRRTAVAWRPGAAPASQPHGVDRAGG